MGKTLSIYVAGSWQDRARLGEYMRNLEKDRRFKITSTWPDRETEKNTPQAEATAKARDAYLDIEEVKEANVVLAVMDDPEYPYRGTFTEIGCALGHEIGKTKKKVIIICPGEHKECSDSDRCTYTHKCMTNVFFHHPHIERVKDEAEAFDALSRAYATLK